LLARRADRLEALADELRTAGGTAAWATGDVTDDVGLPAAFDQLADELGGADVVIANAGFGRAEAPHKFKPGRARATYDVNFTGLLRTIDWAMPRFLEANAGHLVGVASVASFMAFPNAAAYSGSKVAMRFHLQSLRVSLRHYNIAVTTICPGFVESELTAINKGPMPFMWKTDRAARVMADAIEQRRAQLVFPWQMKLLMGVATRLPRPVQEMILARGALRRKPWIGADAADDPSA
ncbi:MAG: SDR family NAD(P)-dependent oxidoreductase, partial [Acidobacteriota bacterium]